MRLPNTTSYGCGIADVRIRSRRLLSALRASPREVRFRLRLPSATQSIASSPTLARHHHGEAEDVYVDMLCSRRVRPSHNTITARLRMCMLTCSVRIWCRETFHPWRHRVFDEHRRMRLVSRSCADVRSCLSPSLLLSPLGELEPHSCGSVYFAGTPRGTPAMTVEGRAPQGRRRRARPSSSRRYLLL